MDFEALEGGKCTKVEDESDREQTEVRGGVLESANLLTLLWHKYPEKSTVEARSTEVALELANELEKPQNVGVLHLKFSKTVNTHTN